MRLYNHFAPMARPLISLQRPYATNAGSKSPFKGFDHIHFWVGNARQAAVYYITRFGFQPCAYRGLETGSRSVATHVVKQGNILFAFSSPLQPNDDAFSRHLARHGDGVKDVAFEVDDCRAVYAAAVAKGAKSIRPPEATSDADGTVVTATVEPYLDTWHTLVQRTGYKGAFLPGFVPTPQDPILKGRPSPGLDIIDHVVSNQEDCQMEPVVQWYTDKFGFHRFWSVDDKDIFTEYSSLRSIVVADPAEVIKMPVNEPAKGRGKSQIQEFVEYYGGPGIQHIALNTPDIITAVSCLRESGVSFIQIPDTYYANLRERLGNVSLQVDEDINVLQKIGILVDFNTEGYLLQTFTRPQQDRPTVFLEIIQRHGLGGFGAGNFKALFEAIERDQQLRGNL
eukprot:EG_transcript_10118